MWRVRKDRVTRCHTPTRLTDGLADKKHVGKADSITLVQGRRASTKIVSMPRDELR
jgi:hypothetical protein